MSEITNNFEKDSCRFEAGSSMNGNVTINAPIYQGTAKPEEKTSDGSCSIGSPLYLSSDKGTKIDLIRIMNAWFECGKVEGSNGKRPTKKEFFTWVGRLFNIDLADYDKDLSNSMATGTGIEKQTRIFEELKSKQEQIYNSK